MLDLPIDLSKVDATKIFDFLYDIFKNDFVLNKTYLAKKIYINPKSDDKEDNKEKVFWHLTSRDEKEYYWENGIRKHRVIGRYPDFKRSSRIKWVKKIIENHEHSKVKYFYHQESNKKRDIRLYLWAYEDDFVVILQKLGKSQSFLVTSFFIDHKGKREDYQRRLENYQNGDEKLENCEWF